MFILWVGAWRRPSTWRSLCRVAGWSGTAHAGWSRGQAAPGQTPAHAHREKTNIKSRLWFIRANKGRIKREYLRGAKCNGVRSPKVYLGSFVQLYSLAETPQLLPPSPAFGLIYEDAIGQPRETTSLCNPLVLLSLWLSSRMKVFVVQ